MEAPRILPREEHWTDHEYVRCAAAQGPVVRDRHGIFITFSYEHMQRLVDPSLTRQMQTETMALQGIESGPLFDLFNNAMLFSNGEAHRNRRGALDATAERALDAPQPAVRQGHLCRAELRVRAQNELAVEALVGLHGPAVDGDAVALDLEEP